jgi:hypothetical protein
MVQKLETMPSQNISTANLAWEPASWCGYLRGVRADRVIDQVRTLSGLLLLVRSIHGIESATWILRIVCCESIGTLRMRTEDKSRWQQVLVNTDKTVRNMASILSCALYHDTDYIGDIGCSIMFICGSMPVLVNPEASVKPPCGSTAWSVNVKETTVRLFG